MFRSFRFPFPHHLRRARAQQNTQTTDSLVSAVVPLRSALRRSSASLLTTFSTAATASSARALSSKTVACVSTTRVFGREGQGKRTKSQLLQGAAKGLGEHEVDEADLKGEPAAVRDEVLPAGALEADGVDKGGEEAGEAAEQLEDGDTAGALGVGPDFDHVG